MSTTSSHGSLRTRSIAAQIPIAGPPALTGRLAAFEHAPPLVVGDDLVELLLLVAPVVEVVGVDRLTECLLGELAALPEPDRLAERRRERLGLPGLVGVALELRAGVGLALDPVQPGRQ